MNYNSNLKLKKFTLLFFLLFSLIHSSLSYNARAEETKKEGQKAEEYFKRGYIFQMTGNIDKAISYYKMSIDIKPTAQAYTFLGWAYSFQGKFDEAIIEARKAIKLDPDYGNPYNDIGVYLIEKGMDDEAIPYFEKAIKSKNYCCYQFPYFNMGRIYLKKKMYERAKKEFKRALEIDPDYSPAKIFLEMLDMIMKES